MFLRAMGNVLMLNTGILHSTRTLWSDNSEGRLSPTVILHRSRAGFPFKSKGSIHYKISRSSVNPTPCSHVMLISVQQALECFLS